MQFIKDGPDVPDSLVDAHEEGRVVFFCGAGISYPAGLMGFGGLVEKLFEVLGQYPDHEQKKAICNKQFDIAIGLLESRRVGGRETVRSKINEILYTDPNTTKLETHEALLTLAKSRKNRVKLITTNFDRLFEHVFNNQYKDINTFKAPLLPVPKQHWDGLVYLHGLLPENGNHSDLENLVISSGDFGLAYLMEGWAARFVCELFKNFTVLFVGYSIDDPILRYMVDALAADKLRGDDSLEMFSFCSYADNSCKDERASEWQAKNVTPILYQDKQNHILLHETLHQWAETYRDGIMGKENIVNEVASLLPANSTKSDDYVSRMIWALSDPTGRPAKRFAEFNPVPSLDWLEPFSENRFGITDLKRFGIIPTDATDSEISFSLLRRPTPYSLSPLMAISNWSDITVEPDEVMSQLCRWLTRHLDKPELLLWLIKDQRKISCFMKRVIKIKLREIQQNNSDDDSDNNNQDGLPDKRMLMLWNLLLAGCIKMHESDPDIFFEWSRKFILEGLNSTLRFELLEMLKPMVKLTEPFKFREENLSQGEIRELVSWEIVLSNVHVGHELLKLGVKDKWDAALQELQPDFTRLLVDALNLMKYLGGADKFMDNSYLSQPSISDHEQNLKMDEWNLLIELNRDAWLSLASNSPEQGLKIAENWLELPYPIFRRLAFFAAAQVGMVPVHKALEWLLSGNGWWLWSNETRREAIRLLVSLAPKLEIAEKNELLDAISSGPPRKMYIPDLKTEDWIKIRNKEILFRLHKFCSAGGQLNESSQMILGQLKKEFPAFKIAEDESDEFLNWHESNPNFKENYNPTPQDIDGLIQWLKDFPGPDIIHPDDWQKRCREDFEIVVLALQTLAKEGTWPRGRWREAFSCWSNDNDLKKKSWEKIAPILEIVPKEKLQEIHDLAGWLREQSKTFEGQEETFLNLCDVFLEMEDSESVSEEEDLITRAINHRVGHVTVGLLNYLYRDSNSIEKPEQDIWDRFSRICDPNKIILRHGRVLLAAKVNLLFETDPRWTKEHLLPLFDWNNSEAEAQSAWKSLLWSPRITMPLMEWLKINFLNTADHYEKLGKHGENYTALLTHYGLQSAKELICNNEIETAINKLPQEALDHASLSLYRSVDSSGDQSNEFWENRVSPFLQDIWPKSNQKLSQKISKYFAMASIKSGDSFPEALNHVNQWLVPLDHPNQIVRSLNKEEVDSTYPEDSLKLLDKVYPDSPRGYLTESLRMCLDNIANKQQELKNDHCFQRLNKIAKK